jgi:mono/diheme cytochrome c family protein
MINRGKIAYENNCISCHMINLAGAENWKGVDEDGHQKAPPLNGTGHTWHHDDKTLHSIIKYGLAKLVEGYDGKMMGFEESLSDKDIDSVLAYIKSYWPKDKYEHQIGISK